MGWRDRDYNRGAEAAREFFSNPASIMSLGIPLGQWFGSRITLHFWLLLTILFIYVAGIRDHASLLVPSVATLVLLVLLMAHEFGHRIAAGWVDGHHEEFVLWPFGGMNPVVTPPRPAPLFIGNVGGIAANALTGVLSGLAFFILANRLPAFPMPGGSSVSILFWVNFLFGWPNAVVISFGQGEFAASLALQFFFYSWGLVLINLLPYFWFDGGNLLQAALWPITGSYKAIAIACWAGMVLAVPMLILNLYATNLMAIILWILLFSSSFVRWQSLRAAGPEELQNAFDDSSSYSEYPTRPRRKIRRGWFRSASRKAAKERAEQARIDTILAKVHQHGLHSLTWGEKRALRKATERQRQQDLAERL